ncbi:MAG: hypothetical protein QF471_05995, partial [Phycisphaerales bacterium]|nr:hypothetical protein [Phycisphaerales bacterium]
MNNILKSICIATVGLLVVGSPSIASADCPAGEIEDCNGNCCPDYWVGDDYCDNGASSYNGIPIYLNCDEFDCDGGDCDPSQCDGGSQGIGACCTPFGCWVTDP